MCFTTNRLKFTGTYSFPFSNQSLGFYLTQTGSELNYTNSVGQYQTILSCPTALGQGVWIINYSCKLILD